MEPASRLGLGDRRGRLLTGGRQRTGQTGWGALRPRCQTGRRAHPTPAQRRGCVAERGHRRRGMRFNAPGTPGSPRGSPETPDLVLGDISVRRRQRRGPLERDGGETPDTEAGAKPRCLGSRQRCRQGLRVAAGVEGRGQEGLVGFKRHWRASRESSRSLALNAAHGNGEDAGQAR